MKTLTITYKYGEEERKIEMTDFTRIEQRDREFVIEQVINHIEKDIIKLVCGKSRNHLTK